MLKTAVLCSISIIIESAASSKPGIEWFKNLRQPKYSLPFSAWYIVGVFYYLICGIIAYRQFHNSEDILTLPVILLALIMVINGLSNLILFKHRSLKMFFRTLYPFIALFMVLIVVLFQNDRLSVGFACIYLLWLCYDIYYFQKLLQLNESGINETPNKN